MLFKQVLTYNTKPHVGSWGWEFVRLWPWPIKTILTKATHLSWGSLVFQWNSGSALKNYLIVVSIFLVKIRVELCLTFVSYSLGTERCYCLWWISATVIKTRHQNSEFESLWKNHTSPFSSWIIPYIWKPVYII